MQALATVRIEDGTGYIVINESDFDARVHTKYSGVLPAHVVAAETPQAPAAVVPPPVQESPWPNMRRVPVVAVSDGAGGYIRINEDDVTDQKVLSDAECAAIDGARKPPAPPATAVASADAGGLSNDGPTIEQYVESGYPARTYPPHGYAEKDSPTLTVYRNVLKMLESPADVVIQALAGFEDVAALAWVKRAEQEGKKQRKTVLEATDARLTALQQPK